MREALRSALRPAGQVAVMAAIVATLVYLPTAALLALVGHFTSLSLHAFMTFGGALNTFSGLAAWWLIAFAGACVYALFAFPWEERVLSWPKKN